MFIKLIEIHGQTNQGLTRYFLREVVLNKRSIIWMSENDRIRHRINNSEGCLPEGLSLNQKYTDIYLFSNIPRETICTVVGDIDHIYKLLETDSALNHRQTIRG